MIDSWIKAGDLFCLRREINRVGGLPILVVDNPYPETSLPKVGSWYPQNFFLFFQTAMTSG